MNVIHKMLLFPVLSSRCGGEGSPIRNIFCLYVYICLFVCIYLVCMHVFTENLVGFHFTSYDAYCNKPLLPLLYKKGNRHLKLHSKMMLFRGHTFFSYYTCSLSFWVKIPPGHLYCLWLSFQKEISRGCKNAWSGSWVLCRTGWPLGNQSHSWHFRTAAKPLGNTLTRRPHFAAEIWDAQRRNRRGPKWQQSSEKIRGGTWLPSCQGGNGHEGPRLYALTTQLMFINVTSHMSLGSPVLQGSFPESVTRAAPRVCEAPGHSPTFPVQSPQEAAAKHWPSWIWTWTTNRDGVFHLSKLQFYQQHRKHW